MIFSSKVGHFQPALDILYISFMKIESLYLDTSYDQCSWQQLIDAPYFIIFADLSTSGISNT